MALVTGSIPNLIGGISQQNPVLRATTQSENIENCDCSIVRGLSKRRPLSWEYNLHAHKELNTSYHFINRDENERYILCIRDGDILPFNLENGDSINISIATLNNLFEWLTFDSTYKKPSEDFLRFFDLDILSGRLDPYSVTSVDKEDTSPQYSDPIHYEQLAVVKSVLNETTDTFTRTFEAYTAASWVIKGTLTYRNIAGTVKIQKSATENFASATDVLTVATLSASNTTKTLDLNSSFTPDSTKPYIRVCTQFTQTTGTKVYNAGSVMRYTTADINSNAFDLTNYNNIRFTSGVFFDSFYSSPATITLRFEKSATEDFTSTDTITTFTATGPSNQTFSYNYTSDSAKPWVRAVLADITNGFRLTPTKMRVKGTTPSYLETDTNGTLKFLTIADFTFIVNPSVVVKENTAKTPDSVGDLLIYTPTTLGGYTDIGLTLGTVKGSISDNYDEESSSEIWALLMNEFITSIDTSNIITLNTALKTSDNTVYGFSFAPGILWVDFRGDDIVFSTTGESTAQRLRAITDTVTSFSQLPSYCVEGYKVKVLNTDKFDEDDYYVEFFPNSSQTPEIDSDIDQDTLAHVDADEKIKIGRWVETAVPDISVGLDNTTMPMLLRRRADGSFAFTAGDWAERKVGDDISNSQPSFVGKTINYVDLYNNRLLFLSGDNIILSELGEFFNFYRTTALTLLDSDPIDIASSGTSVSLLHASIGFHNSLIVFSKDKQYSLTSGNPAYNLTPATINFPIISSFSSLIGIDPVALGNNIYFATELGDHTGIEEYFITKDTSSQGDAVDITAHVPKLLPKNIIKIVGSSTENLLIVLPDNTENVTATDDGRYHSGDSELFVYKYYWQGNEKIQSAWNKWTFENMYISDIFIVNDLLYIIYVDYVGTHVGSMPISEGYTDISEDGILKTIYMDKQVSNEQTTEEYFSIADETVITLPFDVTNTHTWYIVSTSDDGNPGEEQVLGRDPSNSPLTNRVKANGDWTNRSFVIGLKYNQKVTLSPLFIIDEATGAVDKRSEILLKNMSIGYGDTNTFKVSTRHIFENETEETVFDVTDNPYYIQDIPLGNGDFVFSIQGTNKETEITFENDSWTPCSWINAEWEADIVPLSINV